MTAIVVLGFVVAVLLLALAYVLAASQGRADRAYRQGWSHGFALGVRSAFPPAPKPVSHVRRVAS